MLCQVEYKDGYQSLGIDKASVFSFQNKTQATNNKGPPPNIILLLFSLCFTGDGSPKTSQHSARWRLGQNRSKMCSLSFRLMETRWRTFSINLPLSLIPYVQMSEKLGAEISSYENIGFLEWRFCFLPLILGLDSTSSDCSYVFTDEWNRNKFCLLNKMFPSMWNSLMTELHRIMWEHLIPSQWTQSACCLPLFLLTVKGWSISMWYLVCIW